MSYLNQLLDAINDMANDFDDVPPNSVKAVVALSVLYQIDIDNLDSSHVSQVSHKCGIILQSFNHDTMFTSRVLVFTFYDADSGLGRRLDQLKILQRENLLNSIGLKASH